MGDMGDGLLGVIEGRCTLRKCTDEVIAEVSRQNPKASKISKL